MASLYVGKAQSDNAGQQWLKLKNTSTKHEHLTL